METRLSLGIQSQWYNNEQSVICTEIAEPWDWDDVQQNLDTILQMAQSVNYPLGLIVFLPDDLSIPPSGFAQASRAVSQTHADAEFHTIVYVTANRGLQTLWQETIGAFAQDANRYHVVSHLEEALQVLGMA